MAITIKVGEAKTHLSELLSKVEAGEDVVIARGNDPIVRMVKVNNVNARKSMIDTLRSERSARSPVSADDIQNWRHEGQR